VNLQYVIDGIDRAITRYKIRTQHRQRIAQEGLGTHGHRVRNGVDVVTSFKT